MAWTAKITQVDVRYDTVTVHIDIMCDSPEVLIPKVYDFGSAADLTKAAIIGFVKAEINRVGDLYAKANLLMDEIGKTVTITS
jgi:hypothetical protein